MKEKMETDMVIGFRVYRRSKIWCACFSGPTTRTIVHGMWGCAMLRRDFGQVGIS